VSFIVLLRGYFWMLGNDAGHGQQVPAFNGSPYRDGRVAAPCSIR